MGLYCDNKCPVCKAECRLTSDHGHRLNRFEHICKGCGNKWPVKFMPVKEG